MKITVAGPGCNRCKTTEQNVFNACAELNLDAEISHVTDATQIASMGVIMTPSVFIDDKLVSAGKVPTVPELKKLFQSHKG